MKGWHLKRRSSIVSLLLSVGEWISSSRKYPNWETKNARIVPARLSRREQCIRSMVTFCMVVAGTRGSRVRNCAMTAAVMASCITPTLLDPLRVVWLKETNWTSHTNNVASRHTRTNFLRHDPNAKGGKPKSWWTWSKVACDDIMPFRAHSSREKIW